MSKPIIQLNEETVKSELKEMVRNSVEETLNALLNKEAEELTSAAKYERTESRQGYRSGHYSRKLTTTSGEATLNIPKLKGVPFETAIIERYTLSVPKGKIMLVLPFGKCIGVVFVFSAFWTLLVHSRFLRSI